MNNDPRKERLNQMVNFLTTKGVADKPFNISIILKVKPDSVDQMIKAAAKQVEETRKDPACLYYEISQNLADPTQFISVQTWKNAQSLVEHCSCEHHHEFTKIIDEVKEGTPQFNMWVSVTSGESSKEDEKNLKLEQEKTKTA